MKCDKPYYKKRTEKSSEKFFVEELQTKLRKSFLTENFVYI